MPGDLGIGPVAKLMDAVFSWFVSEDGFLEMKQRRALASKKKECHDALAANDFVALKRLTDEFERLSHNP